MKNPLLLSVICLSILSFSAQALTAPKRSDGASQIPTRAAISPQTTPKAPNFYGSERKMLGRLDTTPVILKSKVKKRVTLFGKDFDNRMIRRSLTCLAFEIPALSVGLLSIAFSAFSAFVSLVSFSKSQPDQFFRPLASFLFVVTAGFALFGLVSGVVGLFKAFKKKGNRSERAAAIIAVFWNALFLGASIALLSIR